MPGLSELAILVVAILGATLVVVGMLLLRRRGSQLASGESPSLPPKREAPAASAETHAVVHIHPGAPLTAQLREHANAAEGRGLRPFLELGAVWCPPSRMFGDVLEDPRMQAALAGVYLIRAELDEFSNDPYVRELNARAVPVFYELEADGRWTGRTINGGAWGADTVENMSRTMTAFFAG